MLTARRRLACTLVAPLAVLSACGSSAETTISVQTITFGSPAATPASTSREPTRVSTPPAALPPDIIDPAGARALVDAWDAARARAQSALDASPLGAVESSPALDVDSVELQLERTGVARRPAAPSVDGITVAVPHQAAFPAIVYATQHVTRGPSSAFEVLAFARASASSGWTVAWHATTPDAKTVMPAVQIGPDGFAANLDASAQRGLVADVPALAGRLAALFRPGAGADGAIVLDQGMPDIAATARDTVASFSRSGDAARVEFAGSPTPVAVQTSDGGAGCLVVVTYTATLSAPAAHPLVETASQHQYGQGLLAPGNYVQVVDRYAFVFGASVPATTGGSTIFVFASGGGLVSATGTAAPPTPAA